MNCPTLSPARAHLYNLSQDEYALLWGDGHCPICGKSYSRSRNRIAVVDHDHADGEVRGVCCAACNYSMGTRTPGWFARVAAYLSDPPARALGIRKFHQAFEETR